MPPLHQTPPPLREPDLRELRRRGCTPCFALVGDNAIYNMQRRSSVFAHTTTYSKYCAHMQARIPKKVWSSAHPHFRMPRIVSHLRCHVASTSRLSAHVVSSIVYLGLVDQSAQAKVQQPDIALFLIPDSHTCGRIQPSSSNACWGYRGRDEMGWEHQGNVYRGTNSTITIVRFAREEVHTWMVHVLPYRECRFKLGRYRTTVNNDNQYRTNMWSVL